MRIPKWKAASEYIEVREVIEWRNGQVYRTIHKGYAHRNRTKKDNEIYTSLSTSMTRGEGELDLLILE